MHGRRRRRRDRVLLCRYIYIANLDCHDLNVSALAPPNNKYPPKSLKKIIDSRSVPSVLILGLACMQ